MSAASDFLVGVFSLCWLTPLYSLLRERAVARRPAIMDDLSSLITDCPLPFINPAGFPDGGCESPLPHLPSPCMQSQATARIIGTGQQERSAHVAISRDREGLPASGTKSLTLLLRRHKRPLLRQPHLVLLLLPALPNRALGLQRRLLDENEDRLLVQRPRLHRAGVSVGDVRGAAAGEGAWALFERGVVFEYGGFGGELEL